MERYRDEKFKFTISLYALLERLERCCHLPAAFFSGHNHFTSTGFASILFPPPSLSLCLLFLLSVARLLRQRSEPRECVREQRQIVLVGHGPINPFSGVKFNSPGKRKWERVKLLKIFRTSFTIHSCHVERCLPNSRERDSFDISKELRVFARKPADFIRYKIFNQKP